MKASFLSIAAAALMFAACNEPLNEAAEVEDISQKSSPTNFTDGQTILGKSIENPYSLTYMREALKEFSQTSLSKAALNYEIKANFLYVRFLPKNPEEFETLLSDTTIELFDRPMLCEIIQEGESYHDPSLPKDAITWQYTTVPIDYKFPKVQYEILDSCFVPEDMDESISKSFSDFDATELTPIAFKLAGLESELEKGISKKRKTPKGHFHVWDNYHNKWVGIVGIKVRVYNGIRWDHTHTDFEGNYEMSKRYATTNVHYKIKFRTSDDIIINNKMLDLDAAEEGLGWHSHGGYSKSFDTGSKIWMWATVNNAVYIFRKQLCPKLNIPTPKIKLHVFASNNKSKNWSGCAPMCRHIKVEIAQWQKFCTAYIGVGVQTLFDVIGPDVMIFHNENTQNVYSSVFHEMSHVCHYINAGKSYWEKYVTFIINHFGYGQISQKNSGYVGLGEMWGNYFGNYVCNKEYFGNPFNWEEMEDWYHPGLLKSLHENTLLSNRDIFDCLTGDVTTYEQFKQKLIRKCWQNGKIDECFKNYGF